MTHNVLKDPSYISLHFFINLTGDLFLELTHFYMNGRCFLCITDNIWTFSAMGNNNKKTGLVFLAIGT